MPKTRTEWWQEKFDRNVANDRKNQRSLKKLGWKVIVIWECELKDIEAARLCLKNSLTSD